MSAERLSFQPQKPAEPPLVLPESFLEAIKRERPDNINWDRIDEAVAVLKKPPEPEPTEKQKFWRDMYRSGKLTPYQKDRPWLGWQAAKDAWNNPELQGETSRIMALDMAIRGGADKEYNQLGDMGHRAKRMAVMAGNVVPFTAFDIVTGIPSALLFEYLEAKNKGKPKQTLEQYKQDPDRLKDTLVGGAKKIIEVENDKVVTALGDILAHKLTGERGAWTHEAADKSADLLGTAAEDRFKDVINGPVLESLARILYQIPVAGALIEQGYTRLSLLQEKSQLNKGIAKSFYMGIGLTIHLWRGLHIKLKDPEYKLAPQTPSSRIAHWIWGRLIGHQANAPAPEI